MRQLGTLPNAAQAQTLADYLSTLSIKTQVAPDSDGVAVWVCEEDQVARAREEFQAYLQNPTDERYRQIRRAEAPRPEQAPRPRRRRVPDRVQYPLTLILFVGSVLLTVAYHAPDSREWVCRRFFIAPVFLIDGKEYHEPGARLAKLREGEVWRAVTPIFLHFDVGHILFNMLALFLLGPQFERRYGTLRLLLFVLVVAAVSNLCQYYFGDVSLDGLAVVVGDPSPFFGGMSGVLCGLFGFVWMKVVYEPGCGLALTRTDVAVMLVWLLLCMAGLVGRIANTAHITGLALGMLIGYASAWWNGFGAPLPEA